MTQFGQQPYQQPPQQGYPPQGPPQQPQAPQQPWQQFHPQTPAGPQYQPPFAPGGYGKPMPQVAMFGGVEAAKPMTQANYQRPGRYWQRINKCKTDRSRKNEDFAAIEMTIIKIINTDGVQNPHRVGEDTTRMIMKKQDQFLPEVKAFVCGCTGLPQEQVTEANCNMVFGPDQPLAGMIVEVNGYLITTRAGRPFTKVQFEREVKAAEALSVLDPQLVAHFFPGGALQRVAEHEARNPQPQYPQQPPAPAPAPLNQGYGQQPPQGYQQPPQQPYPQQAQAPPQQPYPPQPYTPPPGQYPAQQPAPQQYPPQGWQQPR